MTQISDAKKRYDEIPIPEELSDVVRSAIDYSAVRKKKNPETAELQDRKESTGSCGSAGRCVYSGTEYQYGFCGEHE